MSKLDDIITDATATAYCAGQDWSKENPTTDKVDAASDTAKQAIKDLVITLANNHAMSDYSINLATFIGELERL